AGGPTRQRSESEYKRLLSLLGGNYNAYTTTDHTCYYINTIPEKAETAVEILSEWMFDNQFTLTEFDREREVITREIEKNNAELGRVFYQLCQSHYYQTHPMRYPVIGYLENFRKTTFEQLKSYYNRYYVASNMILVVGGPMDPDQVMPWIRHHFGRAPSVAPPIHLFTEEPRPFAGRELEKEWETSTAYLSLRFSTIDLFSDDLYALDLLDFMLTNGDESIMYRDIVEDQQLAYSISSSSYSPSVTTGYFDFTLELDPPHLEAAKARVLHHLANIRDGKISADRVDRAKKQKLSEDVFSITTIEDTTSRIGQGYLYAQTPHFYDHYVANFKSVTVDDVVRVARRYFDPDRMIVSLLSPRKTTEATPGVTVYTPSGRQIPQLHRLKNGVRVLLFTESSYPRVYARTYMVGGVRAETAETNGLGYVMADLLATGTDDMSKADISRMIEDRGADISGGIGNNTIFHTMECLSEDFKTLFPLYAKTLLRARFDPSELAETQRQVLKYISQRKDDWYRYALYQFKQSFFMGNPYGFATSGEADVIRRITPEVLDNYKAQHLDPEK
ncbi:insulinase family protein, partial [bacterium]|nr:insulinase family protein [bacterium]